MTASARRPVIAVIGAGQARPEDERAAEQVGRLLAERGAVLLCGGRGGVMDAACRGAAQGAGISIGLLPGDDALEASPHLSVALPTGLGHARNAVVVLAASAVIAVGGGTGTLSEIALALKSGKRVIGLGTWEAHDARGAPAAIQAAASPQEAVDLALGTGLPGQDGGP
jgi:uncharacterized protein (TIGR00725 family)